MFGMINCSGYINIYCEYSLYDIIVCSDKIS